MKVLIDQHWTFSLFLFLIMLLALSQNVVRDTKPWYEYENQKSCCEQWYA